MTALLIEFKQAGTVVRKNIGSQDIFVQNDDDLYVVLLLNSGRVDVQLVDDAMSYSWVIERDPADQTGGGVPQIPGSPGPQIWFEPTSPGNYKLVAYLGTRSQVRSIAQFAIVGSTVAIHSFRLGAHYLRTGRLDGPSPGMSLDANYRLASGGLSGSIGATKIWLGNVGNLTADTFQVDYPENHVHPPGTGTDETGSNVLPLLDTERKPSDPQFIFRAGSSFNPVMGCQTGSGLCIRVNSADYPSFQWADPHPATGGRAGGRSGGLAFVDYVVGFSTFFPKALVPFFQQAWTATACGNLSRINPLGAPNPRPTIVPPVPYRQMVYVPPAPPVGGGECPDGQAPFSLPARHFALGQLVGEALVGEADVLIGELRSSPPKERAGISMRVERVIWGGPILTDSIDLPYAPHGAALGSGDPLAHAWEHVDFSTAKQVLAIRTQRQLHDFGPSDPLMVTSRGAEIEQVLKLVDAARSLNDSSDIATRVDSLRTSPDPAMAGFLYSRIWHQEALSDPTLASKLMLQLIGGASIPAEAWPEVAEDIALSYVLLAETMQDVMIARFIELAQKDDVDAGVAGFHGLSKLNSFTPLRLEPSQSDALSKAYHRLVDVGAMPPDRDLESALSL